MDKKKLYDVVIVGGGPAGLTAAIYLARACYRVIVVEKEKFGGQITITSEVVNYPGIEITDGTELTESMRKQAQNFGAEFMLSEVKSLKVEGDIKEVETGRGTLYCHGILLATGASPRMIGFEGEADYKGHGVAYCATCDGEFFRGKEVFVLGGGFAAAEESVFLTKYAKHVTILVREEDFTCAAATAEHAKEHPNIDVYYNKEVVKVEGDGVLRHIVWKDNVTGEVFEHYAEEGDTFGVFVFAGYQPATQLIKGIADLDKYGYVITDKSQKTSVDGLYAAGDVCIKPLRQVVTATGDGALAATELEKYVSLNQKKTGLYPDKPVREGSMATHTTAKKKQEKTVEDNALFSEEMITQLETVFARMENALVLKLNLDDREVSAELKNYMTELVKHTDKLSVIEEVGDKAEAPCVTICKIDGTPTGLAFHGVPGGHEFTSFVLGLYNVAGPGQALDETIKEQIRAISKPVEIKIIVSLTCTVCPDLVVAAQRIASLSENVKVDVYDMNHFGDIKEKYQIMSVPCLLINDNKPVFGKKDIKQLLQMIG